MRVFEEFFEGFGGIIGPSGGKGSVSSASKTELTLEQVAEMTYKCHSIAWFGTSYQASLFSAEIGDYIFGEGKTVLEAVIQVHERAKALGTLVG